MFSGPLLLLSQQDDLFWKLLPVSCMTTPRWWVGSLVQRLNITFAEVNFWCNWYLAGSNHAGSLDQVQLNLWSDHQVRGDATHETFQHNVNRVLSGVIAQPCAKFSSQIHPLTDAQTRREAEDWAASLALDHCFGTSLSLLCDDFPGVVVGAL